MRPGWPTRIKSRKTPAFAGTRNLLPGYERLLPEEQAAVDVDGLAGDVASLGPDQKAHHRRDLLGSALATRRDLAAHAAPMRTAGRGSAHRVDRAGRDAIGGGVMRRPLARGAA